MFVACCFTAHAQAGGIPFDTGFIALQTLFTGTVAKVASVWLQDYERPRTDDPGQYARWRHLLEKKIKLRESRAD